MGISYHIKRTYIISYKQHLLVPKNTVEKKITPQIKQVDLSIKLAEN